MLIRLTLRDYQTDSLISKKGCQLNLISGLPCWSVIKNPPCNAGDVISTSGWNKIPHATETKPMCHNYRVNYRICVHAMKYST